MFPLLDAARREQSRNLQHQRRSSGALGSLARLSFYALVNLLLFGAQARADEQPLAVLLEPRLKASGWGGQRELLDRAVSQGLADAQLSLATASERDAVLTGEPTLKDCYSPECMDRLGRILAAQGVIYYEAAAVIGGACELRVVYYDLPVSAIGARLAVPCPQLAAAPGVLKELAQRAVVETAARPRGILKVASKPANASLFVDGHEVGITPYKRAAFVGKHDVAVRRAGFRTVITQIEVKDGEVAAVSLELLAGADPAQPTRHPRPRWRIGVGVAALAVGVALVAVGAAGLAVDGRCVDDSGPGFCAAEYDENGERFTRVTSSKAAGAGVLATGVLIGAAGAVLLGLPGERIKTEVALLPQGSLLELFGRF